MVVVSFWACLALVQACLVLKVARILFSSQFCWLLIILCRVSCVTVEHTAVWLVSTEANMLVEISVSEHFYVIHSLMVTDFLDNTQQCLLILAFLQHLFKAQFISLSYIIATYAYAHVCRLYNFIPHVSGTCLVIPTTVQQYHCSSTTQLETVYYNI